MHEVSRGKMRFAIGEFEIYPRLALDFIRDVRRTDADENVIMPMTMQESSRMRRNSTLKTRTY